MRPSGQTDIDLVREATDLVRLIGEHLALTPKGREHVGVCPFHDDHRPSMTVVTHKAHAFYKCHSCGASGDVFDFVMDYHKMDFPSALRYLADRAGITLQTRGPDRAAADDDTSPTALRRANAFAAEFFSATLADPRTGAAARAVIDQRGMEQRIVEAFGIGAAPDQWDGLCDRLRDGGLAIRTAEHAGLIKKRRDGSGYYDSFRNRLIFPICDETGRPVAFGARKIAPDDEPKYLNSAESAVFNKSRILYGLHQARRAIIESSRAVVCEGYTDVIACHQAGLVNVVGTLGTALTRDHARILGRLCDTVVLVFDGDEAGQRAADHAVGVFFTEPIDVKICVLPDGQDPDDMVRVHGPEGLDEAIRGSSDALAYKLDRFRGQLVGVEGLSARQKRLEGFLRELADLGFGAMQGVRKRMVVAQLADLFGVTVNDIERAVPSGRPAPARAAVAPEPSDEPADTSLYEEDASEIGRARRLAERELLGLLVHEPSRGRATAAGDDGSAIAVARLIQAGDFGDPGCRRIAQVLLPAIEDGTHLTMQDLLGELGEPALRSLASTLYFEGEGLVAADDEEAVADRVAQLASALRSHLRRLDYSRSVQAYRQRTTGAEQSADAAREQIRRRQEQGDIASAISTGVRSSG